MMIHCSWEASLRFGTSKMHLSPTVAKAAVHSKGVVVLLLIHLFVYCCSHCLLVFCGWSMFRCAVLSVLSNFTIILMGKR